MSVYVRIWGGLDVLYVLWRVYRDVLESKVPFYSAFAESLSDIQSFGQASVLILTAVGTVVMLSMVLSGPLMLMLHKSGVYISLVQLPFRLILLVPPTFFFVQMSKDYIPLPGWLFISIILIMEIFKVATEIRWLKNVKKGKGGTF